MRILFDQATPVPLRRSLEGHSARTAAQEGWDRLRNGDLLTAAETASFDLFLTTDKNMRYQQNLTGRRIAIVVLGNSSWQIVRLHVDAITTVVNAAMPGSFAEVDIPLPPTKPFTRS